MVERAVFRFEPWSETGERATPYRRRIFDPETGAPIGEVCLKCSEKRGLFRRTVSWSLELFETEDEALVFSMQRSTSRTPFWDVREADGLYVGRLRTPRLLDSDGNLRATIESDGDRWLIVSPFARVLAELNSAGEGLAVRITDDADANPFFRMLLVAAALVNSPLPAV